MSAEPELSKPMELPTFESILRSPQYIAAVDKVGKESAFLAAAELTDDKVKEMASLSAGQSTSEAWHLLRKGRLTASFFGKVLSAKKVSESLLDTITSGSQLDGVEAIRWGRENEPNARKEFEIKTGKKVKETGVWLHSSGLLGASPDGLVRDDAVLEIKCPHKHKEHKIDECISDKSFCLQKDGDYSLKRSHPYWHQVQGQLFLTNRDICHFVVWTLKDLVIVDVAKDPCWAPNLEQLIDIFKRDMLPSLVGNKAGQVHGNS